MEENLEKNAYKYIYIYVCVCVYESLCYIAEINTTFYISYTSLKQKQKDCLGFSM